MKFCIVQFRFEFMIMKNILKTYVRNHIQFKNEFMLLNNLNS